MNEQTKELVDEKLIQVTFENVEKQIEEAMQRVLLLGRKTDRYAQEKGLTPFQTASMRQHYGSAANSLGNALASIVAMHKEAGDKDPRPDTRTGGGGK